MTAFFANVDLYDPTGPDRMEEGNVYGGETRLFVLDAPDMAEALRDLINAVACQNARLDRIHIAAPVSAFEAAVFPFEVDIDSMIKDAVEQGKICVTPDYTFSPYGNNTTGVFYGLFDLYDLKRSGDIPYAGEFTYAARRAKSCGEALLAVLDDLASDDCRLKSVEDFSDVEFYDTSNRLQSGTLADLVASDTATVVWAQGANIYESEDDE